MKNYVSDTDTFIHFEQRSVDKYHPQLCAYVQSFHSAGNFQDDASVKKIIETYFNWCVQIFEQIIRENNDMQFMHYLFTYHESSISLWYRSVQKENLQVKYGINKEDLILNRRILKLALEQMCEINFTKLSEPSTELFQQYDTVIEDLMYVGNELYNAALFLAEMRVLPETLQVVIESNGLLHITRKCIFEYLFNELSCTMKIDFEKGIFDAEGVNQFKDEIQKSFGINYDFAADIIVQIKKYLNPNNWEIQTIEPGILVENLEKTNVVKINAENFYAGLILSKENKLALRDSVYQVNNMERYFFRPILEIMVNGKRRHMIGINKWAESMTVLITNNFQWNKAPEEWKKNNDFKQYLEKKSEEHDSLLEDEVEKVLNENSIPFLRNVTSFNDGKIAKSLILKGVGEIDFIWVDNKRNRIVVADCKYNRARYDMIAFSSDSSNFKNEYEKKIINKVEWIKSNRDLVGKHFKKKYPELNLDIHQLAIEELFIINTPTFYMYTGRLNTVCFFNLLQFMQDQYQHPNLTLHIKNGFKTKIQFKSYPYFKI